MKRRQKLSGKRSRKMFKKGASRTHEKNVRRSPMRGGIRL